VRRKHKEIARAKPDPTPPVVSTFEPDPNHIVVAVVKCHCGQPGSRKMACRKCKTIIARCGTHGNDILKEALEHCR